MGRHAGRAPALLVTALVGVLLAVAGCDATSSPDGAERRGAHGSGADGGAAAAPSPVPPPSASGPLPPAPAGLERFYRQRVSWTPCESEFVCATVQVPLSYADPQGVTVGLAVSRRPADQTGDRVGALLVNPGGPGASGVTYAPTAAAQLGPDVLARYDVAGFDPRGVAGSEGVDCLSDAEVDAFVAMDPTPDDRAAVGAAERALTEFGRGCVQGSGRLAGHVSTLEAARDLDIVRAVLKSPQLHYYGASYGTLLGATYAELFPRRVGAMVLDGAVDPTLSFVERSLQQAAGFETAVQAYLGYCVEQGDCPLGDTTAAAADGLRRLLADIDDDPLPGSGGRELTVGNAVLGVWLPLYAQELWPNLTSAITAAQQGDGAALLQLADLYVSRGPDGYRDNSVEALYAVNCLDEPSGLSPEQVRAELPRFRAASPVFGEVFGWGLLGCVDWPVRAAAQAPVIDAAGAPPIVVVGTTRDPATPYSWSVSLADQLDSGVLVTREGDGHTGLGRGSDCVDEAVRGFYVDGDVPEDGLRCS